MVRKSTGEEIEEQLTQKLDAYVEERAEAAVQDGAEAVAQDRVEDPLATRAIGRIHVELDDEEARAEQDERLTQLLTPIGASAPTVNAVVAGPTESVQATFERNESRVRHGVAAAIISILVVFGIGLGFGMYSRHTQEAAEEAARQAENERIAAEAQAERERAEAEAEALRQQEAARAPRQVQFVVSAAGFNEQATRLPLLITGINAEGQEVETQGFVDSEGKGVSLAPGEYTASVPASPICADGSMYTPPADTFSFQIPNDEQELIQVDQAIVLIPLNAAQLTSDIINNAADWAQKDTQNAGIAETNIAAAWRLKQEEEERKKAEERRKKIEEERPAVAQQFVASYYTNLSFPDEKDDTKILRITNWNAVVGQYVADGSKAQDKLASGPGASFIYAIRVTATSVSEDTATVEASVVATDKVVKGWTKDAKKKTINLTFNDDNKITDFNIS